MYILSKLWYLYSQSIKILILIRELFPLIFVIVPFKLGVEAARRSAEDGHLLPAPRLLSLNLFSDIDRPNKIHTLMLMIWGQFLDHDLTRTAITEIAMDESGTKYDKYTEKTYIIHCQQLLSCCISCSKSTNTNTDNLFDIEL